MKTSEIFRRVRTHLGVGELYMMVHKRYICSALHYLYVTGAIGDRDRMKGKRVIRAHLEGAESLEDWLMKHHGIQSEYTNKYIRKIMATRKAWLTHLIEHYEAKGE